MRTLLLSAVLLLSACVSVPQHPRIDVHLTALRFNQVAGTYLDYPVIVQDGGKTLILQAQEYTTMPTQVAFEREKIAEFLVAIDKFLEWESLATDRGDQFTKKIGAVSYHGANWVVRFHSASKGRHLLSIALRSAVLGDDWTVPGVSDLNLDKANAQALRALLVEFRDGKIATSNVDQIYK